MDILSTVILASWLCGLFGFIVGVFVGRAEGKQYVSRS